MIAPPLESYLARNELWQVNPYETEYLYQEIYEQEAYLHRGFELPANPVIVDIGANIGLFTMFMKDRFPGATIYAFEPAPQTYACLAHNTARFGRSVRTFEVGVSDVDGATSFTFYPGYSVLSGFHTDRERDCSLIVNSIMYFVDGGTRRADVERLVHDRFQQAVVTEVRTRTLSQVIDEQDIFGIDLLKIDAEKSELAILRGIADEHWPIIDRIILEVHEPAELDIVRSILAAKGFEIHVEQEPQLAKAGVFNVYATH